MKTHARRKTLKTVSQNKVSNMIENLKTREKQMIMKTISQSRFSA